MTTSKFSFFKKGIKNKSVNTEISLQEAIRLIRSDKYRDDITRLRESQDKSVRAVIKKNLDYFTFSGTFKERKVSGLIKHSGILCIDLDDLEDVNKTKYLISLNRSILTAFVSPSGNGLKVLFKINPDQHEQCFQYLQEWFLNTFGLEVDKSGKDVSRACFVSYDPGLYFNFEADQVNPSLPLTPLTKTASGETVDTETGEVIQQPKFENWTRKKKEEFDHIKEVVERIVESKKDITSQYDDWLQIGFSLAIFGEEARELFHSVSQLNSDYKREECDAKFSDCIKNGRFKTPAKFFAICKEYSINTKRIKIVPAGIAEGAEGKGYEDMQFKLPEGVDLTPELKKHVFGFSFIEHEGKYFYADYDFNKRLISFYQISNFIIRPLFLIVSRREPRRIIEIENTYGLKKVLEIPAKAFVSLTEFNAFVEGQGDFLPDFDKKQFLKIKSKLYRQSKNAEEIKTLGWHKDGFYGFVNGIFTQPVFNDKGEIKTPAEFIPVDDYGVSSFDDKNYFIPALSSIYKDEEGEYESQKTFCYQKSKVKYKEWSEQFCKVHKDNGKIGLVYLISALFRDIVFERLRVFPHLFLFGPRGSGKSQLAISIVKMFGEGLKPFLIHSGTQVAFHKRFAFFKNAIIWFDEYLNTIDPKRIESLKGAYDGNAHEKSEDTNSNRNRSVPVNSAVLISGQDLPNASNALFTRNILCPFGKTEYSDEEISLHSALMDMEALGLSYITAHLTTFRHIVEKEFFEQFDKVIAEMKENLKEQGYSVEDRLIKNISILFTMFRILEKHLPFPFTANEFKTLCLDNAKYQNNLVGNSQETGVFWSMVEYLLDEGKIKEGIDFRVEAKSHLDVQVGKKEKKKLEFYPGKNILYVRLSKIHPLYLEYHRRQYNKVGMDKESLIHYLMNTSSYLGLVNTVRFDNARTSCYAFDYDKLGVNLDRGDNQSDTPESNTPGPSKGTSDTSLTQNNSDEEDLPF